MSSFGSTAMTLARGNRVAKYNEAIETVVKVGSDFAQAADNAVILASDLIAKFPTDPNIHQQITNGVVSLSKKGLNTALASGVAERILEAVASSAPHLELAR